MELYDVRCLDGGERGGGGERGREGGGGGAWGERGGGGGEGELMAVVVWLLVRADAFSSLVAMVNPASVKRNLIWNSDNLIVYK